MHPNSQISRKRHIRRRKRIKRRSNSVSHREHWDPHNGRVWCPPSITHTSVGERARGKKTLERERERERERDKERGSERKTKERDEKTLEK